MKKRSVQFIAFAIAMAGVFPAAASAQASGAPAAPQKTGVLPTTKNNAMTNPYRMLNDWPHLGAIKAGAAIGLLPDEQGGLWMQHRSVPEIVHIDSSGNIIGKIEAPVSQAHGMCRDREGNFWVLDGGPFVDGADVGVKGSQVFKYSPQGKLLLTLGKAGVSKVGPDTFLAPTACHETPDGNMVIADGHWPRPSTYPQDGDRLVFFTKDGKFIKDFGRHGSGPGEFLGPHGIAFDSQGRMFIADRSNSRIQVFDKNMVFVDEWRQFGRPSNIWITKDDTLYVADSESNQVIPGAVDSPEGASAVRNPGWKTGIRIGNAKDGSLRYFVNGTKPEGLAVDTKGNIFGGLTWECEGSASGSCLQKFVKK